MYYTSARKSTIDVEVSSSFAFVILDGHKATIISLVGLATLRRPSCVTGINCCFSHDVRNTAAFAEASSTSAGENGVQKKQLFSYKAPVVGRSAPDGRKIAAQARGAACRTPMRIVLD